MSDSTNDNDSGIGSNESDLASIKCDGCGCPMLVHKPSQTTVHNAGVSALILSSVVDIGERECKLCGVFMIPVIASYTIRWCGGRKHEPANRIVVPAVIPPKDLAAKR